MSMGDEKKEFDKSLLELLLEFIPGEILGISSLKTSDPVFLDSMTCQ
jgi:hypothetical protein